MISDPQAQPPHAPGAWVVFLYVGLGIFLLICLSACFRIPVTVHPPSAHDGQPIALPTAPTGVIEHADGTIERLNPDFRVPHPGDHPAAPPIDLNGIIMLVLSVITGGGLSGAMVMRSRAKRAENNEDEVYGDLKRSKQPQPQE